MPSSATITTFHTMVANTKARASHANTNWSNFRGHNLSIDPNTATSTHNTYDVGAADHYWRTGYFGAIDILSMTTTATMLIAGNMSATTGAWLFIIEGVAKASIDTNGIDGSYLKALSVDTAAINSLAVTTAKINTNAVTAAKLAVKNIAYSGGSGGYTRTANTYQDVLTAPLTASGVRPVRIYTIPDASNVASYNVGAGGLGMYCRITRDGADIGRVLLSAVGDHGPGAVSIIDPAPAAGAHDYRLSVLSVDNATTMGVYYMVLTSEEI